MKKIALLLALLISPAFGQSFSPPNLSAFTGDCTSSAGSTTLTCTKSQGNALTYTNVNLGAVNFNAANTDTTVTVPAGPNNAYLISQVVVYGCTASITSASFGVFTSAAGAGTSLLGTVAGTNTATGPNATTSTQFANASVNNWLNQSTVFFRTIAAQGTAVTCIVTVRIQYL